MTRRVSLRVQTLLFAGLLMAVTLTVLVFATWHLITSSFKHLQDAVILGDVKAEIFQFDALARAKARLVKDNAEWDDASDYIAGDHPDFLRDNYWPGVDSVGQDLVVVYDADRQLVGFVQSGDAANPESFPPGFSPGMIATESFLADDLRAAMIRVGDRIMLVASAPVTRSDLSGDSTGWLVFAAWVDQDILDEMAEYFAGSVLVEHPLQTRALALVPAEFTLQTRALGTVAALRTPEDSEDGTTYGYRLVFPPIDGMTPAVIRAEFPARILNHAFEIRDRVTYASLWGGALLVLLSFVAFEFVVLRRIIGIERDVRAIADNPDQVKHLAVRGRDEISSLAASTNRMIAAIEAGKRETENQRELLQTVLDAANEGIIALESHRAPDGAVLDFKIVLANKALCKIVGRDAADLVRRMLLEEFPGNREARMFDKYLGVLETGEPESIDKYYDDGSVTGWFRDSVTRWGDGLVILVEDITLRKEREDKLRKSLDEVERLNRAMLGREVRVLELKRQINRLSVELGRPEPFRSDADSAIGA